MTVRQTNLLIKSMSLLLMAAASGVLWWGWQSPTGKGTEAQAKSSQTNETPEAVNTRGVAIADFSSVWDRPLRGPLYDPPPATPKPVAKPKPVVRTPPKPKTPPPPKLDIRLVGTILESGHSMAIAADATGKVDVKSSGQVLDLEPVGVRIEEIAADTVTVSYNGQTSTLKLSKSPRKADARVKKRNRK